MKRKVGFIGLGVMGLPMCRNLLKADYSVVVYDIKESILKTAAREGMEIGTSASDVASKTDVVITMLPDGPDVKDVVLGLDGVLKGAKPGSLLIDMSSISPTVSKEVAEAAKAAGVRMLDAPVSGGQPGAVAGTLSIMVGGSEADFDECKDLLKTMGESVIRVGDVGAGNTAKLCNQIIVAANIAAVGEAFVLVSKAGLDPEVVFKAIKMGLAGSNVMNAKVPLLLERSFEPGFRISLHSKDLANALSAGRDLHVPLPVTSLIQQVLEALKVDGKGDLDHAAIATFFEGLAGVEIRATD